MQGELDMDVLLIVCSTEDFCRKRNLYEEYINDNIKKQRYSFLFQVVYDNTNKIKFFRWMKLTENRWEQRFWTDGFEIEVLRYSFEKEFMDRLLFTKPNQVDCFALVKDGFFKSVQNMIQDEGINFKPIN